MSLADEWYCSIQLLVEPKFSIHSMNISWSGLLPAEYETRPMFTAVQFSILIFISIVYFSTRISITLSSTLVVVLLARDRKMRGGQKFLMVRDSLQLLKLDFTYFNRHFWLSNAHSSLSAGINKQLADFRHYQRHGVPRSDN